MQATLDANTLDIFQGNDGLHEDEEFSKMVETAVYIGTKGNPAQALLEQLEQDNSVDSFLTNSKEELNFLERLKQLVGEVQCASTIC